MKNFFRLLIEMFIIWIAAALFPERIAYDSYRTLALVAVTFVFTWVAIDLLEELLNLIIIICKLKRFITKTTIILFTSMVIIISILTNFAGLIIANQIVPGFTINGTGTYIILTILFDYSCDLFAICTTEVSVNKN